LAPQGPKKISSKLQPSLFRDVALLVVVMFTVVAPLVGVARKILAAGTKFRQGGCWRQVRQRPPPMLKTSMAGPWGLLSVFSVVTTTDVEDVDGRPPGGCCRDLRQQPPLMLKTLMVPPLGVAGGRSDSATTDVEDVDGGPLGGASGRSDSSHHRCGRRR
jgi:hypothetical protein